MSLMTFLIQAREKGINKQYVFYKDERGEIQNICFQNGVFFTINQNKTTRFLNPLRTMDTLFKIQNKDLQIVGSGEYLKEVEFTNYKIKKGERRAWELLS